MAINSIKAEITLALLVTLITLGVYYYLFDLADRRIVFLYGHMNLKADSPMTMGRYWMAGLLLSGFLTVFYLAVRLVFRVVNRSMEITWKHIVKYSILPLMTGVVVIITTTGEPRLSLTTGLSSAVALIVGISIGFNISDDLTAGFKSTLVNLFAGLGVVPFIILFRALELPAKGIMTMDKAVVIVLGCAILALVWLVLSRKIFRSFRPLLHHIIKGALAEAYIGLPMLHYFLATPKGIPYITTSDNFFPDQIGIRIATWILMIGIVILADKMTKLITHPPVFRK